MTTETKRPGAHTFVALQIAFRIARSLRDVVRDVRRHDVSEAQQIVRSASSIAANLGEGNRRQGKDRMHFFRIAAGSADETRVHLQLAVEWGWISRQDIARSLDLIDQELAILWRLTH